MTAHPSAKSTACSLYGVFAVATMAALHTTREGLAALLLVLAFVALFAGMAAAGEA